MVRIKRNQRHSSQDAKDQRLLGYGAACRTTSEKASVNTAAIYLDDAKDQRLLGYGAACRTTSEKASVNTAAIYLDGSAKFW
ncbi:unnamed protein product [Ilex paraguariensis]|uniref:Uncharacterized protein n=1 Tax=Ilex paraguariensis TaxID=185542 RepID=A0ABC8RCT2_9AQUA